MERRLKVNLTLGHGRELDALWVLEKLEHYAKVDNTFELLNWLDTQRYHVNAERQDFELLLRGSKFFDTRLQRGEGSAADLTMHVSHADFKVATDLLCRQDG